MAETHAENRELAPVASKNVETDPGFARTAGSRRQDEARRRPRRRSERRAARAERPVAVAERRAARSKRGVVVFDHTREAAKLPHDVHEVVRERVIVIDEV